MAAKKSDFAIRDAKKAMLSDVNRIRLQYAKLDSLEWSLANDVQTMLEVLKKYKKELRGPLLKFFAGEPMGKIAMRAHKEFIAAMAKYINPETLKLKAEVNVQLLDSLQEQVTRNIDGLLNQFDPLFTERLKAIKAVAAQDAASAVMSELSTVQLKAESLTARTLEAAGKPVKDLPSAWKKLQDKYGSRDTVRYRDGKNYPLNTYLDGRANTTSADVHRLTTQYDAANTGTFTGKISNHGADDTCRMWEGKIVFFTSAGRDIFSKTYPQAAALRTVDEIKNDKSTHMWKFNCRHIVTPYPIQYFDKGEILAELENGFAEAA